MMTFYDQYLDDELPRREALQQQKWAREKKALVDKDTKHKETKTALQAKRDAIKEQMD
ncbi:uncharacterized protein EKO05_0004293 [Ascochyta rabiei]|uniref:uncharacterized protein n=1 Tax=Didymella rabiei TaxID=5454 RepID=UPI00220BDF75|nr:uncharacterized protein EKO05_0004293 [Ascochyta rabiei]UPX13794.1 hypothetical protein EKO05_0004293 [Ascochyta rabiei]